MSNCCKMVELYSQKLWHYMSDVYSFQHMRVSEIGITNDLIYQFMKFYSHYPSQCDVYIDHSSDEKTRGADIDLLIFNSAGNGDRYFIQSKVMNWQGRYKDIRKWNHLGIPQFQKLINWANDPTHMGCPLYLLYNGNTINALLGNSQYGLSIIDANIIRNYRYDQYYHRVRRSISDLTFDILFRAGIHPFHILFCDDPINSQSRKKYERPTKYKLNEIEIEYPYIKVDAATPEQKDQNEIYFQESKLDSEYPRYKVVIRNINDPESNM